MFLTNLPDGRIFGLDAQMFTSMAILFVSMLAFAAILAMLFYRPIREFLAKRAAHIQNDKQLAEQEREEADRLKAQYEQKMKEIEQAKDEILNAARKLAAEKKAAQLAKAQQAADVLRSDATRAIELERERISDEVKQAAMEISAVMAARFVSVAIDESTIEALFNEAAAELEVIA